MADFDKHVTEQIFRYYQFKRDDAMDGLATGETLSSATVTCTDVWGNVTATMISNVAVIDSTKVIYKISNGERGKEYSIKIVGNTSTGQVLVGTAKIKIT